MGNRQSRIDPVVRGLLPFYFVGGIPCERYCSQRSCLRFSVRKELSREIKDTGMT